MPRLSKTLRRKPKQERSRLTRDALFEAAAQILEKDGEGSLTTNRIAERAGVSVGTLYQYFANKTAILAEMARQEERRMAAAQAEAAAGQDPAEAARLAIRTYIAAFKDRPSTRRAALKAVLLEDEPAEISAVRTTRQGPFRHRTM